MESATLHHYAPPHRHYHVITILQARMGSKRLPMKSLLAVWAGMPLAKLVMMRIKKATRPDLTILATTERQRDDILVPMARDCGVEVFRGSEDDVLGRFARTLERFPAEYVIRAAGDNPFLDPQKIDELVDFFIQAQEGSVPCDYATNLHTTSGYPDGVGVEIVRADVLRKLDREVTDPHHREHVFTYIHGNPKYHSRVFLAPMDEVRPHYRLDIDYVEDMIFVRELVERLPKESAPYWTTKEIIDVLDKEPELLKLRKQR